MKQITLKGAAARNAFEALTGEKANQSAKITKSATFDATDYNDESEAESHAKSYSLTCEGFVAVNVHPMSDSPYVHFLRGQEIWRATPEAFSAMSKKGLRLLALERA